MDKKSQQINLSAFKKKALPPKNLSDVQIFEDGSLRYGRVFVLLVLFLVCVSFLAYFQNQLSQSVLLVILVALSAIGVFFLFAFTLGLFSFYSNTSQSSLAYSVFETLTQGIIVTDKIGRIIYSNGSYKSYCGVGKSGRLMPIERLFGEFVEASESIYRLSLAAKDGREGNEEIRLERGFIYNHDENKGSTSQWYRVCVAPLDMKKSRKSKATRLNVWTIEDITNDRQRQENAFQELQKAINFLDDAPAGFMSITSTGHIKFMNATLAYWLGYDLAEFQSGQLKTSDIVRGDGEALIQSTGDYDEVRTRMIDVDLVKRDGHLLPVRLLHRMAGGSHRSLVNSRTLVLNRQPGQDISETLRSVEVKFARFFNSSPIAIAAVDAQGLILTTNAHFEKTFKSVMIGKNGETQKRLSALASKEDQGGLIKAMQMVFNGQHDVDPVDVVLQGEENRSARIYISNIRDQHIEDDTFQHQGDPEEAALVYILDTTEQRALELQFAQGQKMQAIGQLAGGVAHDFNNVLTAIIGFTDLLLSNHGPQSPSFQDLTNIKQNANRAAQLVRQLLAFSRQQTLRPQVLDLSEMMSDLSILLKRLIGEKIELKVRHGRSLWSTKADFNQMEQVIINLVVNAKDAMPEGGLINIETLNVTQAECGKYSFTGFVPNDYVLIKVSDSGEGMPENVMEKVFEPFFSTKEVGQGTGLGLSTVYGIIKQTGGFIYPESAVGEGTVFSIFLPRYEPTEEELESAKQEEIISSSDLTGQETILIVEDEEAVRAFGVRALEARGYKIHQASTGEEALDIMKEFGGEIDLMVSDVVMPEMDGPTLLRNLRPNYPDLKVIFVSGYAEDAFKKNLDEGEVFGFLPKPYSLKQLATAVKESLSL